MAVGYDTRELGRKDCLLSGSFTGNPGIEMDLNPNALYYVLKASLLQ